MFSLLFRKTAEPCCCEPSTQHKTIYFLKIRCHPSTALSYSDRDWGKALPSSYFGQVICLCWMFDRKRGLGAFQSVIEEL
jgi:hypothetical protein